MFCRCNVTEDGMKALATLANGDMRKALNILQVRFDLNFHLLCVQNLTQFHGSKDVHRFYNFLSMNMCSEFSILDMHHM